MFSARSFKQEQKFKLELKREGKELEQELKNGIVDYESYLEKRNNYAEKMSAKLQIGRASCRERVSSTV